MVFWCLPLPDQTQRAAMSWLPDTAAITPSKRWLCCPSARRECILQVYGINGSVFHCGCRPKSRVGSHRYNQSTARYFSDGAACQICRIFVFDFYADLFLPTAGFIPLRKYVDSAWRWCRRFFERDVSCKLSHEPFADPPDCIDAASGGSHERSTQPNDFGCCHRRNACVSAGRAVDGKKISL